METKFTLTEIKNYIKSKDSLGDVMYYLSEENIKKANQESDSLSELKSWVIDKFQEITNEESNGESIDDIEIKRENDNIIIEFTVDCEDYGIHHGNEIIISEDGTLEITLAEVIESGAIGSMLEEAIQSEIIENDVTFGNLF